MNTQKINLQFILISAIILLAAFSRVIPHPANFSPLGAIGLFGGAYFLKKWHALIIPIAATWLSDLFINNVIYAKYYPEFTWFYDGFYWQYASYLLISVVGILFYKKINPSKVVGGALISTIIFFMVSNVGCWVGNLFYPQNANGLLTCYMAGIPFVKGTLLGDLFYTSVLFGTFYLVQKKFQLQPIRK